jgi:hypothetical protein
MITWVRQKDRRYYKAGIKRDLTGQWGLLTSWGSLDSRRGNNDFKLFETKREALQAFVDCCLLRRQHKYEVVADETVDEADTIEA